MKHRNTNLLVVLGGLIFCLMLLTLVLTKSELYKKYSIVSGTIAALLLISVIIYINCTKSDEAIYKSKLNNLLKTYDSILVHIDKIPDFKDKNVMEIETFEELMNVQEEVKKPIFYKVNDKTSAFILIDNNVACSYFLKENKELIDPIEEKIAKDQKIKDTQNIDESILSHIDKTTIIKFKNNKSFKVSPMKK